MISVSNRRQMSHKSMTAIFHSKRFFWIKNHENFSKNSKAICNYVLMFIAPIDQHLFIRRNLDRSVWFSTIFGWMIVSQFVYMFRVASGFLEYMVCICSISASLIVFVSFAAIAYRRATLFESIDEIEKLIDSSKSHFRIIAYHFFKWAMHFRI